MGVGDAMDPGSRGSEFKEHPPTEGINAASRFLDGSPIDLLTFSGFGRLIRLMGSG